jgi:hypothetical protein
MYSYNQGEYLMMRMILTPDLAYNDDDHSTIPHRFHLRRQDNDRDCPQQAHGQVWPWTKKKLWK